MTLVELIQERGLEAVGRFYSKYRAIVVDNKDPDGMTTIRFCIPSGSLLSTTIARYLE